MFDDEGSCYGICYCGKKGEYKGNDVYGGSWIYIYFS